MAPPTSTHPFMLGDLHYSIRDFILNHKGSCQVAMAPFAVFLNDDDRNYVEPDLSVICNLSKIDEKAVMVHRTGLLKLYPRVVREWTML